MEIPVEYLLVLSGDFQPSNCNANENAKVTPLLCSQTLQPVFAGQSLGRICGQTLSSKKYYFLW